MYGEASPTLIKNKHQKQQPGIPGFRVCCLFLKRVGGCIYITCCPTQISRAPSL